MADKREPLMESQDYTDFVATNPEQADPEAYNMARNHSDKAARTNSMWFRAAGDNPFAKKDDSKPEGDKPEEKKGDEKPEGDEPKGDKPEAKKDDKKPEGEKKKSPFPPNKKDGPKDDKKSPAAPKKDGPKDDKGDEKDTAEEAKELLEELKKMNVMKGDDLELDKAIEMLEKLISGDEAGKPSMPGMPPEMPGMKPMKMDILPMPGPKAPAKPGMPPAKPGMPPAKPGMPPMGLKPPMAPHASWVIENTSGFKLGERVWPVETIGSLGHVGDEPGRIVSFAADGTIIVDWGDEIPTQVAATDIVAVKDVAGEDDMFSAADFTSASNESGIDISSIPDELFAKNECEAVLSKLSLKDMLTPLAEDESAADAIVHIASGKVGKLISTASDGRCLVSFDNESVLVWPYEFKMRNAPDLF